jgi:quinol monooxygenase YgiN
MLTHIVIWKYRAEAREEARQEHVARLRRLARVVPGIESFEVGTDVLRLPRSYDTGLVAVFRDRAALDAYTDHPDHLAVVNFGRGISEHVASVDFERERAAGDERRPPAFY